MFLSDNKYLNKIKYKQRATTYPEFYKYWLDVLFERVMRLFVWDFGEDDSYTKVMAKEIEQRLILFGHCFVCMYNDELTVFEGQLNGVTKYNDEFDMYSVRCPVYSDNLIIADKGVVISNNKLRNDTISLCHHYATLLAHTEVTLSLLMVDIRDSNGVPVAKNDITKRSIDNYKSNIYDGVYGTVTDPGGMGVNYAGKTGSHGVNVTDVYYVRDKLIKSFLTDIGVKTALDKKTNTVSDEVNADNSLLVFDTSDMEECRKQACREINDFFNKKWDCNKSPELDYTEAIYETD